MSHTTTQAKPQAVPPSNIATLLHRKNDPPESTREMPELLGSVADGAIAAFFAAGAERPSLPSLLPLWRTVFNN